MLFRSDGFLQVLKDVAVPDGYASNISRRVNMKECKISGLKCHDNHILMQQLFPIALRGSLPSHVTRSLIKLACFFREICSKTLTVSDIVTLEADIAVTLCELEKIFPSSFFTVMVHLVIHLAAEAKIGVQCTTVGCILLRGKIYVILLTNFQFHKKCVRITIANH